MKRVVIAGIGFGGLSAARELAGKGLELILVDRRNYHLFQPLLYQVATAGLEQESIAYPIRVLAQGMPGALFRMADITGVDFEAKTVLTDTGRILYDYLIIAAGSKTSYFGIEGVERHAFDLKKLDQAEDLRNQILLMFERASLEQDLLRRQALLTFVIVGGGPTGVEFSGALRELISQVLVKDYPGIPLPESRIILVEAASSILGAMPEVLQKYAVERLRVMGVEVWLETKVIKADGKQVFLHDGRTVETNTLFWSAGVAAADLAEQVGLPRKSAGRIVVRQDLSIEGHSDVFAVGDMAYFEAQGAPLPMMAPVASQQGRHAARMILASEAGRARTPFCYTDKGSMATIGRSSAVATTHGHNISGFFAWAAWLMLHLYYLIGFRNRIMVLMDWAYYYFFHERMVRLITREQRHEKGG